MIIPAYTGVARWVNPHGLAGQFRPVAPFAVVAGADEYLPNARNWRAVGQQTLAARLFVGFNVGGTPTYELSDLVTLVRAERRRQKQPEDASFIAQRGVYTHSGPRKKVVEEDGGQVIVFRGAKETDRSFAKHMEQLGERIARGMHQAEVILELQRGGIVQEVMGIGP